MDPQQAQCQSQQRPSSQSNQCRVPVTATRVLVAGKTQTLLKGCLSPLLWSLCLLVTQALCPQSCGEAMGKAEPLTPFQPHPWLMLPRVAVVLGQNARKASAFKEEEKPG